jgi:superfamily I DNA/RNA helicase
MDGNRDKVYDLVRKVLQKSYEMTWKLDFDDQNWMPIVRNLPTEQFDLLLVDEAQDLNRCKQEFVMKSGKHLLVVGDEHQAIYGFAGADTESIPRMQRMLGIETALRLTETRRCGKAIVTEANKVVPEFRAHESNSLGEILKSTSKKYEELLVDGDMVLCRINAPLVSEALKRLKQKKKAIIIGRKFGEQLVSFIKSMKATDVGDLVQKVDDWYHAEVAKEQRTRNPSEAKLINLEDKKECVLAFTEGVNTVEDVLREINKVFAGKVCPHCGQHFDEEYDRCTEKGCKTITLPGEYYPVGPLLVMPEGVQYSSVHRAKGKEAENVFILFPELIPHPMAKSAWQKEQEYNLLYVAITRAIKRLIYVSK